MVIKDGNANEQDEIRVSKIATLFLGVLAIILGIVFENQNVAFMVGFAFAIAASCNFPVLVTSTFWKGLTTRGALIGGFLGLISAVVGVVLSPAVWEATLGNPKGSAPGESGEFNHAAMRLARYSSSQPAVLRRRRMKSLPGALRVRL